MSPVGSDQGLLSPAQLFPVVASHKASHRQRPQGTLREKQLREKQNLHAMLLGGGKIPPIIFVFSI